MCKIKTSSSKPIFCNTGNGNVASHLAWDIKSTFDEFNGLSLTNDKSYEEFPSRFLMTDGGLILFEVGQKERYLTLLRLMTKTKI
jgi:hypothetical protein